AAGIKNRPRPSRADARADLRMDVANRQVLTLNLAAGSPPPRGCGHRATTLLRAFQPTLLRASQNTETRRGNERRVGQPTCSTCTANVSDSDSDVGHHRFPRLARPIGWPTT